MKKTIIFVVLAMLVIGYCAAQNANDALRIVGTWVSGDGKTTIIFTANGTGAWDGDNIVYGISANGEICISLNPELSGSYYKLFLSPDGKRMFLNNWMYQKK